MPAWRSRADAPAPAVTEHEARIGGHDLAYTAAGLLEIGEDAVSKASLFYVAYTQKPKEGEVGPMRLSLPDPATSHGG